MAGKPFTTIDVIDLTHVRGGVDKQTRALQMAITEATNAVQEVAKSVTPKNAGMMNMMMQMLSRRRPASGPSGRGPTPAPALPPPTTLTR
jgi:hypothetical protein